MSDYYPFIVSGIVTGSVIGIAALGLVLTYKTSGVFNFAHGMVAAAGAYLFYDLWQGRGVAWPVAGLIAVLVFGPVAGLVLERLARELDGVSVVYKIVATIGFLIAIQGLIVIQYGIEPQVAPTYLPQDSVRILDVNITAQQFILTGVGLTAAIALFVFFRVSRVGTAMRAVVDNADLLDMTGENPVHVRRLSWVIGSSFASLSGVLLAPTLGLDLLPLTILIVQAFGAAAFGLFASLPLTYAGGIVVGLTIELTKKIFANQDALNDISPAMPFVVLFAVLLVVPRRKLVEVGQPVVAPPSRSSLPPRVRAGIGLAVVAFLVLVPHVVGFRLAFWQTAMAQAVLFLSLSVLVRLSGQVSLCHIGFAAVGAAAFGHFVGGDGLPWLVGILLAGLVTVPLGAVVAIPAIRLSGLYLALATFGFGIVLVLVFYTKEFMFGFEGVRAPRPQIWGLDGDTGYYYVLLVVLAVCVTLVVAVERSRLGRLLRALGDSPTALATHGTNVNITRVIVFCISAFIAGVGGAVMGPIVGSAGDEDFNYFQSLVLLAVLVISGRGLVSAAILGALLLNVFPEYALIVLPNAVSGDELTNYLNVAFGLAAVGAALLSKRGSLDAWFGAAAQRARHRGHGPAGARTEAARAVAVAAPGPPAQPPQRVPTGTRS